MYIDRVKIERIRAFDRLEFEFKRPDNTYAGWNVVAGDNASGKSTFLRAITLAMVGPYVASRLAPSLAGWIREGREEGQIEVKIAFDEGDRFEGGRQRPKKPFQARIQLMNRGGDVILEKGKMRLISASRGPWTGDQGAWFSAAYGPFRRLSGSSPEAARLMAIPGRPPRYATLFREDATLAEATAWLQDLRFKSLEGKAREKALLESVIQLLNDDFLQHGFRLDRIDSESLWLTNNSQIKLPLEQMSDGYRSSLALLIDIIRHMAATFGHEGLVEQNDGRCVIPHPGVVLIDEIDAHLHPNWQKHIGGWLKSRFPAVQFITTSHSPFVVQATDEGGLYRLPEPIGNSVALRVPEQEREKLVRQTADEILGSRAFGLEHTRSEKAVEERREFSRLKARQRQNVPLNSAELDVLRQLSMYFVEEE